MRGVFDDRELQQADPPHDTELTLSSTTLLLIFFGLVLLCGLCFGLGYATGRRGTQETAAALPSASGPQATPPGASSRPKPSANAQAAEAQSSQETNQQESAGPDPAGGVVASPAAAGTGAPGGSLEVKPALGSAANPAQAAPPAAAAVTPALAPAPGSLMVQIAAVSGQEDADVLMSALRRRGYAVAARREPLDGMIHVRIGPFKTRAEADGWRQKLLNDGYNAIVQP